MNYALAFIAEFVFLAFLVFIGVLIWSSLDSFVRNKIMDYKTRRWIRTHPAEYKAEIERMNRMLDRALEEMSKSFVEKNK